MEKALQESRNKSAAENLRNMPREKEYKRVLLVSWRNVPKERKVQEMRSTSKELSMRNIKKVQKQKRLSGNKTRIYTDRN